MPSRALTGLFAVLLTLATSAGVARAASWRSVAPLQRSSIPPNELVRPPRPVQLGPLWFPDTVLEPLAWSDLNGWRDDNHAEAFATFAASCRAVLAHARSSTDARPILAALANVCRKVAAAFPRDARAFFEENFRPVRITKLGERAGFLTGYYEPSVDGSRFPTREFTVPLYRRPNDLLPASGEGSPQSFPNSGRAMRRRADGSLVPYYTRAEIEDGVLDGQRLEICWIKDPIDLIFIQIQGSARVQLEDGTTLRVNYDGYNGHPYTPVGRVLIERGEVPREQMSMGRIRTWMNAHPDEARALRDENRSYVFFRVVGLSGKEEARGAQGLPLTPERSIAVDKALHVYGTPFFIQAGLPLGPSGGNAPFHRVMIAQDTGSAIVGPARADVFFGAGDDAGKIAGRLRHPAEFALLVPRSLDPAIAGSAMPVPLPRPRMIAQDPHRQRLEKKPPRRARFFQPVQARWR
jgi:membrane-bound lytic murein transglycosylase A